MFASIVDVVTVCLRFELRISFFRVENLGFVAVSIVNAHHTMFPSSAHKSISLTQELMLILKFLILIKLISNFFYLVSFFFRRHQTRRLSLFSIHSFPSVFERAHFFTLNVVVVVSFILPYRLFVTFERSRNVWSFLYS